MYLWGVMGCAALLVACSQEPSGQLTADGGSGPVGTCPAEPEPDAGPWLPVDGGSFNECGAGISARATLVIGLDGSCSFPNPFSPLQKDERIVVTVVSPSGASNDLSCNPTCAGPGWNFNSATNPTKFQFCRATCEALRQTPTLDLELVGLCPIAH